MNPMAVSCGKLSGLIRSCCWISMSSPLSHAELQFPIAVLEFVAAIGTLAMFSPDLPATATLVLEVDALATAQKLMDDAAKSPLMQHAHDVLCLYARRPCSTHRQCAAAACPRGSYSWRCECRCRRDQPRLHRCRGATCALDCPSAYAGACPTTLFDGTDTSRAARITSTRLRLADRTAGSPPTPCLRAVSYSTTSRAWASLLERAACTAAAS